MNSILKWPLSLRRSLSSRLWPSRRELEQEIVAELEVNLDEALIPVKPRSDFVSGLKMRLIAAPEPQLPSISPALQYTILGALGLLSGIIILVTGIRATVTLLGTIGLLSQLKKRGTPA